MYDIQQLEREWKRYRRKRILTAVLVPAVLLVVAAGGYWGVRMAIMNDTNTTSVSPGTVAVTQAHTPKPSPLPKPESPLKSSPVRKKGWKMTFADEEKGADSESASPVRHVDIQVQTKKTEYTVQEIEKRFRFARNKEDALFLARYYYDKKQYTKALSWALETNKIDSNIEESWLIFGRAKAKLGQRKEAIRVLQAYYDRTGSQKSKKLLDSIRRGMAF